MATAVITFGRMNPPTVGHEKLVNKLKAEARGETAFVYLSHSQNSSKDPLSYNDKVKYATRAFGRIVKKSTARTIIEVMKELEGKYSAVKLVVGSDRVNEFKTLLNKYNGKDYNFDKIEVVSAGERDPDSEGVSGMSASKMRDAVKNNEFATFRLGLPKKLKSSDLEIFKKVQQGMGIKESIEEAIDATPKGRPFTFNIEEKDIDDEELEKIAKVMDDEDLEDLGVDMAKFIMDIDDEDEDDEEEMDEERKPLSIMQRRKMAMRMKRLAPRMARFRKMRKKRMATKDRLIFRARKKAVQLLRKRVAGKKGEQYASLSPAEKIGVDRMIMKKRPLVAKLAKRLLPKVKKAEMERLKQARKESVNESFEMFIERAAQDPDINKRAGTQPAKYHKGLSPATKAKRDAQFKKQASMSDDNPAAYKPAPGDATAKTKLSKYTKQYRAMYGEASSPEITVGSYTTTHFHMCGSAIKAMKKHSDVEGAEQMTKLQDDFYKMEKEVMERGAANNDEKQKAQKLYNQIMSLAKKADIEKEVGSYMKMHLNSILKGDPKPGFGMVNEQDALARTKDAHKREKEQLKVQHDREKDAARLRDARAKNRMTEAKRGRPKKGESEEEGIEHIQVQLRKVINLRGMRPVEFTNNKKVKVSVQVAQRVLDIINKTKDAKGKQDIVKYIQKSPENLNSVAAGKPVQKADKFALPVLKSLGAQTDYVGTARVSGISGSYARNMGKLEGFDINAMFESVVDKAKNIDESFEAYLTEKNIKSYKNHSTSSIAPRDNYLLEKDMEGLRKKADKSGISYGTLKKVYDRGVAAWKSGHRPGTTPSQWGYARVNAFITKKKKGGLNHDTDLAHYEDIRGELMNEEPLEIGTDKIRKKYQEDTPGETGEIKLAVDYVKKPEIAPTAKQLQKKIDEEFEEFLDVVMIEEPTSLDEAFTAGIPDAPFAHQLGISVQGGFAHHPSVEEEMSRAQQAAIAISKKESGKYDKEGNRVKEEGECESCGCKPEPIEEAEYEGKKVKLNDPIRTSEVPSKKFKVYVRDPDSGNIKVVRFGDPNLSIKRDDPDRRKSFRARHNCDNPGPKTKARYWSCYQWRASAKVDN